MKKLVSFGILAVCVLVIGCSSQNTETLILGQWYNQSLEVKLNYPNGGDSTFSVPAGHWEETLQIKPINTTYYKNGTFTSEYVALDGSPIQTTEGTWVVKGDSLYLTQDGVTGAYYFEWMDGKAAFTGLLDWDSDGNADDLYSGVQIKRE